MNFNLSAVDDLLKDPSDQPSIGLILCKSKKGLAVEYALRNTTTRHLKALSEGLKENLPTVKDLAAGLGASKESRE